MNSELYDNKYKIPNDIIKIVQSKLYTTNGGEGLKRAKFIVKNGHATYQMLKRLKNFFDNFNPNAQKKEEYELAGGSKMKAFVDKTLNSERSKVERKQEINRDMGKVEPLESGQMPGVVNRTPQLKESVEMEELLINALAIIFDDEMRVLLLKRSSYPDQWMPNKWSFPGGGVENDEDPSVAVRREVYEETGLEIPQFIEKFVIQRDDTNVEHMFITKLPKTHDNYDVKVDKENDGWGWFKLEEINKLDTVPNLMDYTRIAIKKYD